MRSLSFYLKNVFLVLKLKGRVATMRMFPKPLNEVIECRYIENDRVIETIKCKIVEIVEKPDVNTLAKYLDISGFENVEDWIRAAKKLHKRMPRYLLIVERA